MKKSEEEYETINLATKVSRKEMSVIKDIVKHLGFGTPYELLKYMVSVIIRYADIWHGADYETEQEVKDFFKLFAEVRNKKSIIGATARHPQCDIEKPTICVCSYPNGTIVAYRWKDGEILYTFNIDDIATKILKETHPTTCSMLQRVAKAYGLRSLPKVIEELAQDACKEIGDYDDDDLGYSQNEYGNVPKKTRNNGK